MKVVIVTGSRKLNYNGEDLLRNALSAVKAEIVFHGGATGADTAAHEWCREAGRIAFVHFPDYGRWGDRAPLMRNHHMVDNAIRCSPDTIVIAAPAPDSRGTVHCARYAIEQGLEVYDITGRLPWTKNAC